MIACISNENRTDIATLFEGNDALVKEFESIDANGNVSTINEPRIVFNAINSNKTLSKKFTCLEFDWEVIEISSILKIKVENETLTESVEITYSKEVKVD